MGKGLGVLVGTGSGGQKEIVEALQEKGIEVATTATLWPRDHYVYINAGYVKSGSPGWLDGNAFGEGGNILVGEGFVFVSDMAYLHEHIANRLPKKPSYAQIKTEITSEGERSYPDTRVHVVPTGYFHGGKGHSHIDMFALLLPAKRLLLLDTYYGEGAGRAIEYDLIAEAEGLRLMRYDGSRDGVWYPLNSLVLPTKEGEMAVVDDRAKSLIGLLQNAGVEVIGVKMPQIESPCGKIRCQTNIYRLGDNPETHLAGI